MHPLTRPLDYLWRVRDGWPRRGLRPGEAMLLFEAILQSPYHNTSSFHQALLEHPLPGDVLERMSELLHELTRETAQHMLRQKKLPPRARFRALWSLKNNVGLHAELLHEQHLTREEIHLLEIFRAYHNSWSSAQDMEELDHLGGLALSLTPSQREVFTGLVADHNGGSITGRDLQDYLECARDI